MYQHVYFYVCRWHLTTCAVSWCVTTNDIHLRERIWISRHEHQLEKTFCLRIGPRFNAPCCNLCTRDGNNFNWVTTYRYLGVYITSSRELKYSFAEAKKSYFRAFNVIFGKIGRSATENVFLKLIEAKCKPVLLYGQDACPVNAAAKSSFDSYSLGH